MSDNDVSGLSIPIEVLQDAARRCDGYQTEYGVFLTWDVHMFGLRLIATHGGDKLSRTIELKHLAQSKVPHLILRSAEEQVLRGLSS